MRENDKLLVAEDRQPTKKPFLKRNVGKPVLFAVLLILICFSSVVAWEDYQKQRQADAKLKQWKVEQLVKQAQKQQPKSPIPSPTNKPSTPQVKTTQPSVDPDPPVHCQIDPMCGGGTKPLKKSECDNTVCCYTPDGFKLRTKQECPTNPNRPTATPFQVPTYTNNTVRYVPCTIYYPALNKSETYTNLYTTSEQCAAEQQRVNQFGTTVQPVSSPTPQPTVDPELRVECKANATKLREQLYEVCRTTDWTSSAEEHICFINVKNEWEHNIYLCETLN